MGMSHDKKKVSQKVSRLGVLNLHFGTLRDTFFSRKSSVVETWDLHH